MMITKRYVVEVYACDMMSIRNVVSKSDYERMIKRCEKQYQDSQFSADSAFVAEKRFEIIEDDRVVRKETMYTLGTTDFVFVEKTAKDGYCFSRKK